MLEQLAELIDWRAAPALTPPRAQELLDRAQTVDHEGRAPGAVGYVPTFSLEWAASLVAREKAIRAAQGWQVTRYQGEGALVERTAPDWLRVADDFARQATARAPGAVTPLGVHVFELEDYTPAEAARGLGGAVTNRD